MQHAGREKDWGGTEREREKRGGRHVEEDQTAQKSDGKMTREMGGCGSGVGGSEGFFEDGEKEKERKKRCSRRRRGWQRAGRRLRPDKVGVGQSADRRRRRRNTEERGGTSTSEGRLTLSVVSVVPDQRGETPRRGQRKVPRSSLVIPTLLFSSKTQTRYYRAACG